MAKLILFDLGNTLVDYHTGPLTDEEKDRLGLAAMADLLFEWGRPTTTGELEARFYQPWISVFPQRSSRTAEFDLLPFLRPVIGVEPLSPGRLDDLMRAFWAPSAHHAVPLGDCQTALPRLAARGCRLGLLSNTPVPGTCHDDTLRRLGLLEWLEPRIYSYDCGLRKPDPAIFRLALERAGCRPEQATMVGDSVEADLLPALELGMGAVWFVGARRTREPTVGERRVLEERGIRVVRDIREV